jgi:hypothetical protein
MERKQSAFYNTIALTSTALSTAERKAESQDSIILSFMQAHPYQGFTPFEVHRAVMNDRTPITSTRRALSSLCKRGELVKLDETVKEKYDQVNHKWCYIPREQTGRLF